MDATEVEAFRPDGLLSRPRVLATLALVVAGLVGGGLLVGWPLGSCNLHTASQLAGTPRRFDLHLSASCRDLSQRDVVVSYLLDVVYPVAYGLGLRWALRALWPGWRIGRLRNLGATITLVPVVAAGFDLAENAATLAFVRTASGAAPTLRSESGALLVTTLAWCKWLLVIVSLVAILSAARATWIGRGIRSRAAEPVPAADEQADPPPGDTAANANVLGVCCSGGGIRSAAYSLGALRGLDEARILQEARWLSAVSGGAYTAGAYVTGRMGEPAGQVDLADLEAYLSTADEQGHRRHHFLSNPPGGLTRSLLWMVGLVIANVILVTMAVVTVAWPAGWVLGTWVFEGAIERIGDTTSWARVAGVPARLWVPGTAVFAVGVATMGVSALWGRAWKQVMRAGMAIAALGLALLVLLVVAPLLLVVPWWLLHDSTNHLETPLAFGLSSAALFGIVGKLAAQPLIKSAPRLGGVLLAVAVVALAGLVSTGALTGRGFWGDPEIWWAIAPVFGLLFCFMGVGWLSARLMYRSRLRGSFSISARTTPAGASGGGTIRTVGPNAAGEHPTWTDARPSGPELVICAAAQRMGRGQNGIPAESFTISPTEVRFGATTVPTPAYLAALPPWMASERTISSWQATTGAAFSSAMGRFRYGTTNALLAALNIDLGGWVPNPRRVEAGLTGFPRARLGYLLKEILGIYDHDDDYVFVADGGQWENLGLVELMRRRADVILCIDASGDAAGEFTTLRQAVDLATTELDVWVDLDFLDAMRDPRGGLPPTTVGVTTIGYDVSMAEAGTPASPTGLLLFAKAQVARDLPLALRRFAAADGTFPRYSTADQLLRPDQFQNLVELGRTSAVRLIQIVEDLRSLNP